jgi:shikimate dehydrogenase
MDWNLRGLSVTIPHKTTVAALLDELDPIARGCGAVNTLAVLGGRLIGRNTDVDGVMDPLERACAIGDESFGIIGAGGAARATAYGLRTRGARVRIFARDPELARDWAARLSVSVEPLRVLGASDVSVVVNATPVGMAGRLDQGTSPIPGSWLRGRRLAYDLVYNPVETQFLSDARAEGCGTITGIEMLVAQAVRQFEMWTGREGPVDLMRAAALETVTRGGAR